MSKLDTDNIRLSGDAKSIVDRAKALLEIDTKVQNNGLSPGAGVEVAAAFCGNNSPQFKARCELLFDTDSIDQVKSSEAVSICNAFSGARSKSISI